MSTDRVGLVRAIGNILSTLLLGETKERIVRMEKDLEYVRRDLDRDVKPVLNNVSERVTILWEGRVSTRHSPLALNERGRSILTYSGVKEILAAKRKALEGEIRERDPRNPYRLQEDVKSVVFALKDDPDILAQLEEGAYNVGEDVDTVLFVGALALRDLLLPTFSFERGENERSERSGSGK